MNASPAKELEWTRPFPSVAAPTLGIWSGGDRFLLEEGMVASRDHVAGHWLQLHAPAQINELLLEFLA